MTEQPPERSGQRRLFVLNGGFFARPRLRRILNLAGWRLAVGRPDEGEASLPEWKQGEYKLGNQL